jgi:signal transduction histidine kinase
MRMLRRALWPAGLVFGIAAELIGRPPLPALDAATGFALIALGLVAWETRPRFASGMIMAVTGFAWFLGSIAGWAVFLHRAPLAQLILTYPAKRLWPRSPLERLGIVGAYAYALIYPIAANNEATIAFAVATVALTGWRYVYTGGPERRARRAALAVATPFALVLIVGAALRLDGVTTGTTLLVAYELVVLLIAVGLFANLRWGEWAQATVTALVVDLGNPASAGTLRDRLARALADPSLTVAYWLPEQAEYVDETGRPLVLPSSDEHRTVTFIKDGGTPLAAVIHEPVALNDPELPSGITAAVGLALANARLQAEVRARVEQVKASRRRLVEAADEQRRQLEHELRQATEQQLAQVAGLLGDDEPQLEEVKAELDAARSELRKLALGIHPATLTSTGLSAALTELAARSTVPVNLTVPAGRWPPAVEAAAYFICSEALANIAKHANASVVQIHITDTESELRIEVADDGVGGANPATGSGLRGLQDRAEALGGHFAISSPPGRGTRLAANIPVETQPSRAGPPPSTPPLEVSPSADERPSGDQAGSSFGGGGQRLLKQRRDRRSPRPPEAS